NQHRATEFVLISECSQQRLELRQIRNVRAKISAVVMRPAKVDDRGPAHEILFVQVRAEVVQINDAVPELALRIELSENEIAHPKIRAEDRQLSVTNSVFEFDLPGGLQRTRNLVRRIGHPEIRQLRGIE